MGKSSSGISGYWYPLVYWHVLGLTCDALLEVRGGLKTAWAGEFTASGTITINAPNLWGGEKDQGGVVGAMDVMFGEATQEPNAYLVANLNAPVASQYSEYSDAGSSLNPSPAPVAGSRVSAWRGFTSVVFKGGYWGANNPYPQEASYKIRRILAAMAEVGDWYTETAEIDNIIGESHLPSVGRQVDASSVVGLNMPTLVTEQMALQYGWPYTALDAYFRFARGNESGLVFSKWAESAHNDDEAIAVLVPRGWQLDQTVLMKAASGLLGMAVIRLNGTGSPPAVEGFTWNEGGTANTIFGQVRLWFAPGLTVANRIESRSINPAHWLYYLRTHDAVGREPVENMNDANWRASADKLYAEGFGICVEYDPDQESLEEHEQRICKLIGGSVSRGLDGQYYLDLARGDYDIDALPVLTDDDVISFKELPTVLDGAVNSVSVKYFDPERKEEIITPSDADLALVDAFGLIHQVNEYREIPCSPLATRIAHRDRLDFSTPTKAYELVTNRTPYGWRPNTYFRAQLPKRGITDMVCLLGEVQDGTLASGAIKVKAALDIYSLPTAGFTEVEPGGSTAPVTEATPITLQVAFEAPYIEAVQRIPRAELAAVPEDAGYLQAVAADLVGQRNYTMMVADAGGDYTQAGDGAWCPVAEVAAAYGRIDAVLQLSGAIGLGEVAVGSAGLWGEEIVRVDDIDEDAGTLTVGRACADTTPAKHAAGSRIWFYDNGAAASTTEYTDGETVDVKLLSNTSSQQLALSAATAMSVTFDRRIARPYPPAKVRINTEADPSYLFGELTIEWVHRDRLLQADQLVDTEAATIGPEAGTTYTMRTYVDGVLDDEQTGIVVTTATVTPSADGLVRVEIESERDSLASWQAQVREFVWTSSEMTPLLAEDGATITAEDGDPIYLE